MRALYPGSIDGDFLEFGFGETGKGFGDSFCVALAVDADGAEKAGGGLLVANGGAELHHGLVMVAWVGGVEKRLDELAVGFCGVGGIFVVGLVGCNAGEDTDDVSVYDGGGIGEGDAADGCCCVGADAWETEPAFRVGGKFAGWDSGDFFGEFVEISSAGVVAETFPAFENFFF